MSTHAMKTKLLLLAFASVLPVQFCAAQSDEPADDWKPATSNQQGKQYPQVNSERRVRYRIAALQAQSVRIGGTTLTKGDDGLWTGISRPMDEGFHYYRINIDGVDVPDPNSLSTVRAVGAAASKSPRMTRILST